jgi:hypothetical protein
LVLLTVIVATPARVVAAAGIVLLVLVTCVDNVAHVIGIADIVMDGWGPVPRSSLVLVD